MYPFFLSMNNIYPRRGGAPLNLLEIIVQKYNLYQSTLALNFNITFEFDGDFYFVISNKKSFGQVV